MRLSSQEIINAARQIAIGAEPFLYAGLLSEEIAVDNQMMVKRDFIRQAFYDLGIEMAFSGKNEHEKGVIIDIDDNQMNAAGINQNTLRFGQTVVKAVHL